MDAGGRIPQLSIVDVGHGNAAVLEDTKGVVIVDCGRRTSLLEFLKAAGITRVRVVLISHADKDHIEGLISLIESEEVVIDRVRLNTDGLKGSRLWKSLVYLLDNCHRKGTLDFAVGLTERDSGEFDQGMIGIRVLAPRPALAAIGPGGSDQKGRAIESNSVSVVVRLERDGKPLVLLGGDIDETGLQNLLEYVDDVTAPVAVFPHHGGRPGKGDIERFAVDFCRRVQPYLIIFSIGRDTYDNPRPEIVSVVLRELPSVQVVCTQLSRHCAKHLPHVEANHTSPGFAQGAESRQCCGGTVVLSLAGEPRVVYPNRDAHQQFIMHVAPSALCRCQEGEPKP